MGCCDVEAVVFADTVTRGYPLVSYEIVSAKHATLTAELLQLARPVIESIVSRRTQWRRACCCLREATNSRAILWITVQDGGRDVVGAETALLHSIVRHCGALGVA